MWAKDGSNEPHFGIHCEIRWLVEFAKFVFLMNETALDAALFGFKMRYNDAYNEFEKITMTWGFEHIFIRFN